MDPGGHVATRKDLSFKAGEDVDLIVQVWADDAHTAAQNITNWTAKMQISDHAGTALYDATSNLTINGPAGQIALHIPGATTGAWTWRVGEYDLFAYGPSSIPTKCIIEGDVTVRAKVTT